MGEKKVKVFGFLMLVPGFTCLFIAQPLNIQIFPLEPLKPTTNLHCPKGNTIASYCAIVCVYIYYLY